jgi:hypothetical protein
MVPRPPPGEDTSGIVSLTSPARSKGRPFVLALCAAIVAGAAGACVLSARANGESCLKGEDCLSGLCVASQCRAMPALLDAEATGDATLSDGSEVDAATGDVIAMEATMSRDSGGSTAETGSGDETSTADADSADSGTE